MNKKHAAAPKTNFRHSRAFLCAKLCLIICFVHAQKKTVQRRFPSALSLAPRPVFAVLSHTALFKSEKYFSYYSK